MTMDEGTGPRKLSTEIALANIYFLLACLWLVPDCRGQGTMTVTFDGTQPGIMTQFGANPYIDASCFQVGSLTPQSAYFSGGGIAPGPGLRRLVGLHSGQP